MCPFAGGGWIACAGIHAKGLRAELSERFLDPLRGKPGMADLVYLI